MITSPFHLYSCSSNQLHFTVKVLLQVTQNLITGPISSSIVKIFLLNYLISPFGPLDNINFAELNFCKLGNLKVNAGYCKNSM